MHVRTTFFHGLRESAATDVVREAGERLNDDEAVDAVLGVVQDFCRDEPAFARVVRRVDNAVDVVHEFVAVGVVLVELERLHGLLDSFRGMREQLGGDTAFETVGNRVGRESAPDLFGAYNFIDAEEVRHAGEIDFHAVVHQVVFDVAVGAWVEVHEDFAEHGDTRLADALLAAFRDFDLVELFDAGAEHFDKALGRADFCFLERGGGLHQFRHPLAVNLLGVALVDFVGAQRTVHRFDGVHEDEAPKHMEAEVEPELESRMHAGGVEAGRDDGNVLVAGFVERLAAKHGVLHGAAVFAVLGQAHRNFGLRNVRVFFEPLEAFADVDLAGEADVVVDVLLAEFDGSFVCDRQVIGKVALALDVGARENGKSGREVRRQDDALGLVACHERRVELRFV